ncbi:Hypothetical_protein [Hexamita inflata]|uniref:Hypothetical_protein n=1 Tax=Hexamita inflata TaxID=28002 RepID=A0AA86RR75_9EUKA|nr:Hypothetical protein HINF_LOCUS64209 [Hexamita inflata]
MEIIFVQNDQTTLSDEQNQRDTLYIAPEEVKLELLKFNFIIKFIYSYFQEYMQIPRQKLSQKMKYYPNTRTLEDVVHSPDQQRLLYFDMLTKLTFKSKNVDKSQFEDHTNYDKSQVAALIGIVSSNDNLIVVIGKSCLNVVIFEKVYSIYKYNQNACRSKLIDTIFV